MQPSDAWPDGASERPTEDLCRAGESVAPLQIRCFGLLAVTCFGRTIDSWPRRKPRELLAFLATRPGLSAGRQELIAALWPTYDYLSADHLLRTTLWQLRRRLAAEAESAVAVATRSKATTEQDQALVRAVRDGHAVRRLAERCALDPALCGCDLQAVRLSLANLQAITLDEQSHQSGIATRWLALAEHALRPLLQSETFAWLPALRRELRDLGLAALTRAIEAARSAGELRLALEAATHRLAIDPTHEETVEVAMRLHLEQGNAAAAAASYRAFCAALARRYAPTNADLARPTRALRALYRSLATDQFTEDPPPILPSSPANDQPLASVLDSGEAPQRVVPRDVVSRARLTPTSMLDSLSNRPQSAPEPRSLFTEIPASQWKRGLRTRAGAPVYVVLLSVAVLLGLAYAVGGGPAAVHAAPATSARPTIRASAPFASAAVRLAATPAPTPAATPTSTPSLTPTPAPTPTPASSSNPSGNSSTSSNWGLPFLPDPGQWVQQALSAAFTAIASGLLSGLRNILDWAMGLHTSSLNFISLTPPGGTYQSASVVALWRWALRVMDAALAVIAMWGGYNALLRHQIGARYHSALEFLPRLALAALAANLSLLFAGFFIDLNNALCDGIGAASLPGYGQFGDIGNLGQDIALLLLALIYGVVGVLLVLQMLLRLALLDLLIITGPLGLLCWALPQTQAWARLWTSTFVATTLVQFLQMATLKLGAALILELTPGRLDNAVLTLLVGIADLYLTFKIPGMLRTWALRSVGAASVGGLVEYGVSMARAAASVASAVA
jgi:DNA-binding SARP family transcriptional activator